MHPTQTSLFCFKGPNRQADGQGGRHTGRGAVSGNGQTDNKQAGRLKERQTGGRTDRNTQLLGIQTDIKTRQQAGRKRQTERRTRRQTYRRGVDGWTDRQGADGRTDIQTD